MNDESTVGLPDNGRSFAAVLAAAGGIGMLVNHFSSHVNLMMLALGPILLFLGIGGIIEPKILWSVGKYGKHLPIVYRSIGVGLSALGVVVTILLLLFVYRFGPPN